MTEAQAAAYLAKRVKTDPRAVAPLEQINARKPQSILERIASTVPQNGAETYEQAVARLETPKNKYSAVKTIIDGIQFDSKGEAKRYAQLKFEEHTGIISNLELQKRFELIVNGIRIGRYTADFTYIRDGVQITEDFKGIKTPIYKLRKRLVHALYGIQILETGVRK